MTTQNCMRRELTLFTFDVEMNGELRYGSQAYMEITGCALMVVRICSLITETDIRPDDGTGSIKTAMT